MIPVLFAGRWLAGCLIVLLCTLHAAFAQEPDGPALYKQQCALCHENPGQTRAPLPAAMKLMSPENVLRALEVGRMKDQGALITPAQRRMLAEFLTGKPLGQPAQGPAAKLCADLKTPLAPSSTDWNGWSPHSANARF